MFWSTAIRLVSQAPDNLVYHLFTLIAIAIAFSLALWQWRRIPQDEFSWRLMVATAGLLITRVIIPLSNASTPSTLRPLIIPPLERALDTAVILFLVWALLPQLKNLPRLNDALLLLSLFVTGLSFSFANQSWAAQYTADTAYGSTPQADLWGAGQIILLIAATLLLAATRPSDWLTRLLTLLPLTLASGAQLAGYQPDVINLATLAPDVQQGTIAIWHRLAYFLTFPFLAYLIQRHILRDLLIGGFGSNSLTTSLPTILGAAEQIIQPHNPAQQMAQAAEVAAQMFNAQFTAVASLSAPADEHMPIALYQLTADPAHKEWTLRLADWSGFQTAINKKEMVELLPNGLGARQLYGLRQELNLGEMGPILITPLVTQENEVNGLLILGTDPNQEQWPDHLKPSILSLATYIATVRTTTSVEPS